MKKTQKPTATPSPTLATVDANGLNESEAKASKLMAEQVPEVVAAFKDYREGERTYLSRFWTLAETLRKPVTLKAPGGKELPPHRLNGREVTILLLGLGEHKVRVSEWKRVVEMDDDAFALCRKHQVSKVETLAAARGTLLLEEGDDGQLKETNVKKAKPTATETEAKSHRFPKDLMEKLHTAISESAIKPSNDDIPYVMKGKCDDGREYLVHVYLDRAPTKAE